MRGAERARGRERNNVRGGEELERLDGRKKAENRKSGKRGAPRGRRSPRGIRRNGAIPRNGQAWRRPCPGIKLNSVGPPRALRSASRHGAPPAVWLFFRVLGQSRPWKADCDHQAPRAKRRGEGAGDFDSTQSARRRVPTTFRIRLSTPYLPWPASGLRIENARRWEKGESDHAAQAACEPARRRLNARPAPSHPPARDPAPWAAARAGSSLTGVCPTLPARRAARAWEADQASGERGFRTPAKRSGPTRRAAPAPPLSPP